MELIADLKNCNITVLDGNITWKIPKSKEKEIKKSLENNDYNFLLEEIIVHGTILINDFYIDEETERPEIIN